MIQPASKGPFVQVKASIVDAEYVTRATFYGGPNGAADAHANARYFAHAANVLPGCVEAMEMAVLILMRVVADQSDNAQASRALKNVKAAIDAARGGR